jgi:hypothetical protein
MEKPNSSVISMMFGNRAPGADIETFERFRKWTLEVYNPLQLKVHGLTGIDNYQVVRESFEYPSYGIIFHFESMQAWGDYIKTPEGVAIRHEAIIWVERGVRDGIWSAAYKLIKSYRSESPSLTPKLKTPQLFHLRLFVYLKKKKKNTQAGLPSTVNLLLLFSSGCPD